MVCTGGLWREHLGQIQVCATGPCTDTAQSGFGAEWSIHPTDLRLDAPIGNISLELFVWIYWMCLSCHFTCVDLLDVFIFVLWLILCLCMTGHENVACPKCEKPLKFKNFKRHLIACHSLPNDEAQRLVNEAKQSMPARGGETASCSFCGHEMWRRNVANHMLICKANTSVKTAASTSVTQGGDEADSRGGPWCEHWG